MVKIYTHILSVTIVLTAIGLEQNLTAAQASSLVRTLVVASYCSENELDDASFQIQNLISDICFEQNIEAKNVVVKSLKIRKKTLSVDNFPPFIAGDGSLGFPYPPKSEEIKPYESECAPDFFFGSSSYLRAGPCCA